MILQECMWKAEAIQANVSCGFCVEVMGSAGSGKGTLTDTVIKLAWGPSSAKME